MRVNDDLGKRLTHQLAQFAPFAKWFSSSEARNILVQAFRVYKVPFADISRLPDAPLILDFEFVRAVFCRAELIYPDPKLWDTFATPDGGFDVGNNQVVKVPAEGGWTYPDIGEVWRTTRDGMVLLLITPSSIEEKIRTSRTGTYMSFGEQPAAPTLKRLV